MPALSGERKAEIAAELRTASTWVAGPRSVKLRAIADELEDSGSTRSKSKGKKPSSSPNVTEEEG